MSTLFPQTRSIIVPFLANSKLFFSFQLIEEKVLLENEVEDMRGQQDVVQRLRDEIKGENSLYAKFREFAQ